MKCNEIDKNKSHMNLDNLDKALHDLGMLSAITEARCEYLRENKSNYTVMLNSRYVSNVTVGYCMKRAVNKNRLCPYVLPVRHRTKSENSDGAVNADIKLLEPSTSGCSRHVFGDSLAKNMHSTKRCQSLENLTLTSDSHQGKESSPDMECVSTRIQKLQVDE